MMLPKPTTWKSKKWTQGAKGQACTMNLDCCNYDPSTTVFAHKGGAGMGMKADDHDGADMCYACHLIYDGARSNLTRDELSLRFVAARLATIENRLSQGIEKQKVKELKAQLESEAL